MKNITVKDIVKATGGFLLCGDEDTPITGLCIRLMLMVLRKSLLLVRRLIMAWSRLNQLLLGFLSMIMVIVVLISYVVVLKMALVAMLFWLMMYGD